MTTKKSKDSSLKKKEDAFIQELLDGPLTFGEAVEALRLRDGFSQVAFAKKMGISKQYLCDVEKGRRYVSPEQAVRFSKAFGHAPSLFVRLALQDSVTASGLNFIVHVEEEAA